ncbi:MAG: hypothetical protein Q7U73_09410 [Rubrivivax sp.]|nr:hypothetical protein [Rubrivivax sp.]
MPRVKALGRGRGRRAVLSARFDIAALRPPAALPAGQVRHPAQDHPGWPALHRWCLDGAGPGTRSFWSPASAPTIGLRFAVATLVGADIATQRALSQALCLERDGSLQMQACHTWGRLQVRGATKLHDAMWWRARQPTDAWDCGYVIDTPGGLQALARFVPRRATLMVADGLPPQALATVAAGLQARQAQFTHAVRLLAIGARTMTEGLAATTITVATPAC